MRTSTRHGLKPVLPSLALVLLLSGCTAVVRPGSPSSTTVHTQGVIVWSELNLEFHFPGVVVLSRQASPHHFDSEFRSDTTLHGVYADVDSRMRARGWTRIRYDERPNRITAEYERGRERAHVEVHQEGRSGRYRLKIDD